MAPSVESANGPVYVCVGPPSIVYFVEPRRSRRRSPTATDRRVTYQPFEPFGDGGATLGVVTGAVASIWNVVVFVASMLPWVSVEK